MVDLPFVTQHARNRAEDVLGALSVTGAAMLVSPEGEIGMARRTADIVLAQLAKEAVRRCYRDAVTSFAADGACIYAVYVRHGWILCAVSTLPLAPGSMIERVLWGANALTYSFSDGRTTPPSTGGSGGEGAPGEVWAEMLRPRS